jgi:hypothetical protein
MRFELYHPQCVESCQEVWEMSFEATAILLRRPRLAGMFSFVDGLIKFRNSGFPTLLSVRLLECPAAAGTTLIFQNLDADFEIATVRG